MAELDNEQYQSDLFERIFAGAVTVNSLPHDLFKQLRDIFVDVVSQGFGPPSSFSAGSPAQRLAQNFDSNVRVFSAAKTFHQVNDMTQHITDDFGNKRSFTEFEDIAKEVFDKYNREWLRVEQDTAFRQAQSGKQWRRIEENKHLYPFLRYETVGDDRVRDDHESMEGITRPVDDPFWDTHFPPNGWNCRCPKPRQLRSGRSSDVRGVPDPPDLFKNNPGKDGFIFKEDVGDGLEHPYFKVEERFEVLKQNGFGLV